MERILGLDLGTNSIGWAVINRDSKEGHTNLTGIEAAGSRIIPMDASILGAFDKGNSKSQTAERTGFRGVRRLRERHLLRRERLHRVLDILGFLPQHYSQELDRYGKFKSSSEPKLAWRLNSLGKYEFIFQDSFNEMLNDFRSQQPELFEKQDNKIPYDWTIYYLRKKALTKKINKEELAWLILNFNQKRGYYQLRGEDEAEKPNKLEEYYKLKVISVDIDPDNKKGKDTWYNIGLENGWIYRRSSHIPLDWVGKTKEFIVTTDLNDDGSFKLDKDGNVKRSFHAPSTDDWTLLKKKTEADIDNSKETVGEYIYNALLSNPSQKIRGKLVRTIERKYYKEELKRILDCQTVFHPELKNQQLFEACIDELYQVNEAHKNILSNCNFTHLFLNDIIFYQRPLKSKKSLIDDCPFEKRTYVDKETGEIKTVPVKCIAKSNPLFQEFRLWQFISNLRIYQLEREIDIDDKQLDLFGENKPKKKLETDVDITSELLPDENAYAELFDWLNTKESIDQSAFLKYPQFKLKGHEANYRWNYVTDKKYPCNETHAKILSLLKKANAKENVLSHDFENELWHILYSIDDKNELCTALSTFSKKHGLDDSDFVGVFSKFPPFKKDYGAFSAKAIKKMLPLMRCGKYWSADEIDQNTKQRIDKIITGEYDESIRNRVRELSFNLEDISMFRQLPVWLACYIVYDRHSEAEDIDKWEKPEDIDNYLATFRQHSLRNPIVEQVITETLRTVRDIWKQVGHIDEIHVELGREMKNPADKRARIAQQVSDNENTNLRIKALLTDFLNPDFGINGVHPFSPSQQDLLRIYEEGVFNSVGDIPDEIQSILKKFNESDSAKRPTHTEIMRYKLWLEQKYCSPYTGSVIPLGELFTSSYEIEHVIPQSRYFDDSFSNKVICESAVNKLKDNQLGYEFIKNHHGQIVTTDGGKKVKIFSAEEYEKFVREHYSRNHAKLKKLLMDDIPDDFIQRQLNDSRYISKVIKGLLSNVVREKDEQEATSKNVITLAGSITDRLKKDWGMNDVWNSIILPRFERLNKIKETSVFTAQANGHTIPAMPLELQKGFSKKRIDHRHHAMDAIVIACTSREHVNLLNNEAAQSQNKANRFQLSHKLRRYEKVIINGEERNVPQEFIKPWATFTQDAKVALSNIIVSFKQNLRIINKGSNYYQHFENGKKTLVKQSKGDNLSIRKSMHKDTVFGLVNLRRIKEVRLSEALKNPKTIVDKEFKKVIVNLLSSGLKEKEIKNYFKDKDEWTDVNLNKISVYYFTNDTNDRFYATRFCNDLVSVFSGVKKEKVNDTIAKITDNSIQQILLRHFEESGYDPEIAFSPDGIDKMNLNIKNLNNGKNHKPIYKVRLLEKANKFAIGQTGNKKFKFVEADKGTNLYYGIYQTKTIDKESKEEILGRSFTSIPLNVAIDRLKHKLLPVPETNENGDKLLFWLSPNDLVYLPTTQEIKQGISLQHMDKERIYKMVSSTSNRSYFIKYYVANSIIDKDEFTQLNKVERSIADNMEYGEMIKDTCIPIKVDRLGNITQINNNNV
jgi:CRISPR-associated endonuclease Csn1